MIDRTQLKVGDRVALKTDSNGGCVKGYVKEVAPDHLVVREDGVDYYDSIWLNNILMDAWILTPGQPLELLDKE